MCVCEHIHMNIYMRVYIWQLHNLLQITTVLHNFTPTTICISLSG